MKRFYYILVAALCSHFAVGQTNVISNNKALGFQNPALQNADYTTGYATASYIINPLSETSNYSNYLFLAEFKPNKNFRVGLHSSTLDNRLNKLDVHKLYGSFSFEFEEGSRFAVGVETGIQKDMTKLAEFNKIFYPTVHHFEDSIAQGVDIGFGVAYFSDQFSIGIAFNRLTKPLIVDQPYQHYAIKATDSTVIVKKDTQVTWSEADFIPSKLQSSFNMSFKWSTDKVSVQHLLHVTNIDFEGYGFLGFQNFITFNQKGVVGLGVYENGEWSYFGSLGYNITPGLSLEVGAFFHKEFEYDPNAAYKEVKVDEGYTLEAKGAYVSNGYKPSLEFNVSYRF